MRKLLVLVLALVLVIAFASPAFAVNGSGGAGEAFGQHHSDHAITNQGFTGGENPGMHQGFAGWTGH